MNKVICLAVLLGIMAAGVPASAAITATGPFTGALQETWESFPNYLDQPGRMLPDPTEIMGGAASISSPRMAVYGGDIATFGLGSYGFAPVSDGAKGMGLDRPDQTATILFSDPVDCFGAYWGTHGPIATLTPDVSVSFFDLDSNPIGSASFRYAGGGQLEWHGWTSDVKISKITYFGDYVVNDGLQANYAGNPVVPELPAPLLAMIPGMIGLAVRRRK